VPGCSGKEEIRLDTGAKENPVGYGRDKKEEKKVGPSLQRSETHLPD